MTFPLTVPALRVEQPIGTFFVAVLPARVLLDTAYSDRLQAVREGSGVGYELRGTQRKLETVRLRAIASYLGGHDAAIPNSLILAANFRQDDGLVEEEEALRWRVEEEADGCHRLVVPTNAKLAAIIDGQHRLFSFRYAKPVLLDTQLVCTLLFDVPKPVQAQLFASVNTNQVQVDKSTTFELFGYNVGDEPEGVWSPDKVAVYLTRRLNSDPASPLRDRVTLAPAGDDPRARESGRWRVSLATVVQGLLRLMSGNPKEDRNLLHQERGRSRSWLTSSTRKEASPLRALYVEGNDKLIYALVLNYLRAVDEVFWRDAPAGSYITKTVGVQALLDVLLALVPGALSENDVSVEHFSGRLAPAGTIDFSTDAFRNASGAGRTGIKKAILGRLGPLGPGAVGDSGRPVLR